MHRSHKLQMQHARICKFAADKTSKKFPAYFLLKSFTPAFVWKYFNSAFSWKNFNPAFSQKKLRCTDTIRWRKWKWDAPIYLKYLHTVTFSRDFPPPLSTVLCGKHFSSLCVCVSMAGRLSLSPKTVCLCVGFNVLHPYLMDLDLLCSVMVWIWICSAILWIWTCSSLLCYAMLWIWTCSAMLWNAIELLERPFPSSRSVLFADNGIYCWLLCIHSDWYVLFPSFIHLEI